MEYNCPYCKSIKKPKRVGYFFPKIVKCIECGKINFEREFFMIEKKEIKKVPELLHVNNS